MRIEVMPERCIGSGNCVDVAPRYFDQSDMGGVVEVLVSDVAPADHEAVAQAADICPVAAIMLGIASPAQ
jgi:ferredoxin